MIRATTNFDGRQLRAKGATFTKMSREDRARVLIADDHQCFLDRVLKVLEGEFTVVGAVTSGAQLVFAAGALEPDAVVIDVSMPDMTGLEALDAIRARGLHTPAVFLTAWQEAEIVEAAWHAGALGFVVKTAVASDLVPALRAALQGQRFLSSSAVQPVSHSA